jgi:hypothetical protein
VVVVEIDRERLSVLVVPDLPVQTVADRLHHSADDLPVGEQRVDDAAAVVHREDVLDPNFARLPGAFYSYFTQASVGGRCVWEFGQVTNGNTFGGAAQYGSPTARFFGTLGSDILTNTITC